MNISKAWTLGKAGMQVNATKRKFTAQSIEFVGFNLTKIGYKPLRLQVEASLKITPPNTVRCMWEFIGTINFIKKHIPNWAKLIRPLAELTKKDTKVNWGPQQQQDFEEIKAQVAKSIILMYPDINKIFHIYTDASDYGFGAVLCQVKDR